MKPTGYDETRSPPLHVQNARASGTANALPPPSLAAVVAGAFVRLRLKQRVRVLRRLLLPIGPMALVVLGGGAFAKYASKARWPRMPVSLEDAARVTATQVYELGRYIEQSNPAVLQQVLAVLARDAVTMAALGGSMAALMIEQFGRPKPGRTPAG